MASCAKTPCGARIRNLFPAGFARGIRRAAALPAAAQPEPMREVEFVQPVVEGKGGVYFKVRHHLFRRPAEHHATLVYDRHGVEVVELREIVDYADESLAPRAAQSAQEVEYRIFRERVEARSHFVAAHGGRVSRELHAKPYAAQLAARKRANELAGVLPEPHGFENFRKPFRAARLRNPRYLQRASDCLRHGQHRVRAGKLRGESHPAHQFVGGFYLPTLEERLPLRRDYPKHRFDEGRLPASGRADNGVHRAPFE